MSDSRNTWNRYQHLKSFTNPALTQNVSAIPGVLNQLREFISNNGAHNLLSEGNLNRLWLIVAKYNNQVPAYSYAPNQLINDLKAAHEIIDSIPLVNAPTQNIQARPTPHSAPINPYAPRSAPLNPYANPMVRRTPLDPYAPPTPKNIPTNNEIQTNKQSTASIAQALSIDVTKKNSTIPETRNKKQEISIEDLFKRGIEYKPIPIHQADWRLQSLDNDPALYSVADLSELLKIAQPVPFGENKDKVVRFLVTENNEVVLGLEGAPKGKIPAHCQMANLDISNAMCLTAGNAFFNEKGEITKINHKSGDFRPSFDSLQHALLLLVKAGVHFAAEVHIDQLNDKGGVEKRFTVKGENIAAHYRQPESITKQLIEDNQTPPRIKR